MKKRRKRRVLDAAFRRRKKCNVGEACYAIPPLLPSKLSAQPAANIKFLSPHPPCPPPPLSVWIEHTHTLPQWGDKQKKRKRMRKNQVGDKKIPFHSMHVRPSLPYRPLRATLSKAKPMPATVTSARRREGKRRIPTRLCSTHIKAVSSLSCVTWISVLLPLAVFLAEEIDI